VKSVNKCECLLVSHCSSVIQCTYRVFYNTVLALLKVTLHSIDTYIGNARNLKQEIVFEICNIMTQANFQNCGQLFLKRSL